MSKHRKKHVVNYDRLFDNSRLPKEGSASRKVADKFLNAPMKSIVLDKKELGIIVGLDINYGFRFVKCKEPYAYMLVSRNNEDYMKKAFDTELESV